MLTLAAPCTSLHDHGVSATCRYVSLSVAGASVLASGPERARNGAVRCTLRATPTPQRTAATRRLSIACALRSTTAGRRQNESRGRKRKRKRKRSQKGKRQRKEGKRLESEAKSRGERGRTGIFGSKIGHFHANCIIGPWSRSTSIWNKSTRTHQK